MDCLDISTTRSSIYPGLELEDLPLDAFPGEVFPFIHRLENRVHDVYTLTVSYIFQTVVPLSAYPLAFPKALAFEAILPAVPLAVDSLLKPSTRS